MSLVAEIIRQIVEGLRKAAHEHTKGKHSFRRKKSIAMILILERHQSIYRFEVPFLFGALRAIGR